jgi:hypothetical protein
MTAPDCQHVLRGLLSERPRQGNDDSRCNVDRDEARNDDATGRKLYSQEVAAEPAHNWRLGVDQFGGQHARLPFKVSADLTARTPTLQAESFALGGKIVIPINNLPRLRLQHGRPCVEFASVPHRPACPRTQPCSRFEFFTPRSRLALRQLHHIAHLLAPSDLNSGSLTGSRGVVILNNRESFQ